MIKNILSYFGIYIEERIFIRISYKIKLKLEHDRENWVDIDIKNYILIYYGI